MNFTESYPLSELTQYLCNNKYVIPVDIDDFENLNNKENETKYRQQHFNILKPYMFRMINMRILFILNLNQKRRFMVGIKEFLKPAIDEMNCVMGVDAMDTVWIPNWLLEDDTLVDKFINEIKNEYLKSGYIVDNTVIIINL